MAKEITKEMSIGQVLEVDRGTAEILTQFGMHCFGCPYSMAETLEDACAVHGNNVEELIDQLNANLSEKER